MREQATERPGRQPEYEDLSKAILPAGVTQPVSVFLQNIFNIEPVTVMTIFYF